MAPLTTSKKKGPRRKKLNTSEDLDDYNNDRCSDVRAVKETDLNVYVYNT